MSLISFRISHRFNPVIACATHFGISLIQPSNLVKPFVTGIRCIGNSDLEMYSTPGWGNALDMQALLLMMAILWEKATGLMWLAE